MLQRLRQGLTLALIALLPFHALFVTVLTKMIAGPDHAPLSWLALWKEGVLAVILLLAVIESRRLFVYSFIRLFERAKQTNETRKTKNERVQFFGTLDALILLLLLLSVLVTALTHANWSLYLFGFRYDFVPLVAFLILRRVTWSDLFMKHAMTVLLWSGALVAAYGILTFFVPSEFFSWLGYSDLHSLYVADRPIAAFQQIGGTDLRRIQGPMSGPNQLGLWLLIPLGIVLGELRVSHSGLRASGPRTAGYGLRVLAVRNIALVTILLALFLTFSRAAWIAAFVMAAVALYPAVRTLSHRVLMGLGTAGLCGVILLGFLFPSVILRLSSSRGHLHNPIEAVQEMIEHPLGKGMGTAGPASNRVSETCVLLLENDDPTWWKENRPDMCVFVGEEQVQPAGKDCNCPFLPENWYLQIGVEMGWVGFVLYLILVGAILARLKLKIKHEKLKMEEFFIFHFSFFIRLVFLALSVAALFLHAFEDAAVAYTLWILIAVVMGSMQEKRDSLI